MTKQSPIAEKIAALLRKAQSTNHPEEAETFAAKARALMEKHQISSAMVEATGEDPDPMGTDRTNTYKKGSPASVKYELEIRVAKFYGCQVIVMNYEDTGRAHIEIHGPASARITHQAMFPFLWKQVCKKANDHTGDKAEARKLQREIARAFGDRLIRIKEEQNQARVKAAPTGSTALMVLDQIQARTEDFVQDHYARLGLEIKPGKARRLTPPGYLARTLAEQIALDAQVEKDEDKDEDPLLIE